jgi:hypothetical protein
VLPQARMIVVLFGLRMRSPFPSVSIASTQSRKQMTTCRTSQPICSQTAVTPPWLPGASPFAHNACRCAHLPSPHLPAGPYCLCPIPMDPSFLIPGGCYLKHDRVHFLPSTPGREAIYHFVCSVTSFCSAHFPSLFTLSLLANPIIAPEAISTYCPVI